MSYSQTIWLKPRVKQRPRLGKRGKAFTPAETKRYEEAVRTAYDGPLFEGPVSVSIVYDKSSTTVTITPDNVDRVKFQGDIDNYVKATLDGLNGAAWYDDGQITNLKVRYARKTTRPSGSGS